MRAARVAHLFALIQILIVCGRVVAFSVVDVIAP